MDIAGKTALVTGGAAGIGKTISGLLVERGATVVIADLERAEVEGAGPEYAAAKAGVMRLTTSLAHLAERGIRVNCVSPHTVGTPAVRDRIAALEAAGEPLPPDLAEAGKSAPPPRAPPRPRASASFAGSLRR